MYLRKQLNKVYKSKIKVTIVTRTFDEYGETIEPETTKSRDKETITEEINTLFLKDIKSSIQNDNFENQDD